MDSTSIPIVFIHIGGAPPEYARIAVQQARRWNPSADIIFLSSVIPEEGYGVGEHWIALADIPKGPLHLRFEQVTRLDVSFREGFWRSTTERFFYLEDWMRSRGIEECFHLENDNTLYADISELAPTLRANTNGLSATFMGATKPELVPYMCFSILYCKSVNALSRFISIIAVNTSMANDMQRGADYWLENPEDCSLLPTAPKGVKLASETYRNLHENINFSCIFDAAAHGQYIGGEDPRNGKGGPGFINTLTEYRADQFLYGWKLDTLGRRYPVLTCAMGKEWKLVNLHIHCKRLGDFI